jgi:guanylate kinase
MSSSGDMPAPRGGRPRLIVVSAPSGAGKTTLCKRLLASHPDMVYSVSCTTRHPRGNEVDGENYHFLSESEFVNRLEAGEFLEHARVHENLYGTLRKTVEDALRAGHSVLMDIDVQGAAQIRGVVASLPLGDRLRDAYMDIFVEPPSLQTLRERLLARAEDAPEVIERRMRQAAGEMAQAACYQHRVINDDLEAAYRRFEAIVESGLR